MKQSKMIMVVGGIVVLLAIGGVILMSRSSSDMAQTAEPQESMTTTQEETAETTMTNQNIVEVAQGAGGFTTLLAAAEAAGLVSTLTGDGPYTVFAPTDEAFNKLPAGTVEALLKDKEKLTQILTYHVVPGKVMAKDVVTLTSTTTVQGQDVKVKVDNGTVMINDATVVTTDIEASNGVIHVIDTVLMPQ